MTRLVGLGVKGLEQRCRTKLLDSTSVPGSVNNRRISGPGQTGTEPYSPLALLLHELY